jgi:hypothetical protein
MQQKSLFLNPINQYSLIKNSFMFFLCVFVCGYFNQSMAQNNDGATQSTNTQQEQLNLQAILKDANLEDAALQKPNQSNSSNNSYHLAPVKHQPNAQQIHQFSYKDGSTFISEQRQTSNPSREINVKTAGLNYSFARDRAYHDSTQKNNRLMQVNVFKYK